MKAFTTIIILAVLGFGAWYFLDNKKAEAPEIDEVANTATTTPNGTATSTNNGTGTNVDVNAGVNVSVPKVVAVTVTGSNYKFDVATIKAKKGDTVKITFVNSVGTHDLRVEGYDVGTKILAAGAKETIEFVANKKGTFEYYCSVGSHRAQGMKGSLIVE